MEQPVTVAAPSELQACSPWLLEESKQPQVPSEESVGVPLAQRVLQTSRGEHLQGGHRVKAFEGVVLLTRCFKELLGMCKTCYGIFRGRIKGGSVRGNQSEGKGDKRVCLTKLCAWSPWSILLINLIFLHNKKNNYVLLLITRTTLAFLPSTSCVDTPSILSLGERPPAAFKPDQWAAAWELSAGSWSRTVNPRGWRVPVPAPGSQELQQPHSSWRRAEGNSQGAVTTGSRYP